jgi:hypothetical protein
MKITLKNQMKIKTPKKTKKHIRKKHAIEVLSHQIYSKIIG